MYLVKTPPVVKSLFPDYIWDIPDTENTVYLTFDDGPVPQVTPWVLDQLDAYGFKATFFCVGENVRKYPHVYQQIIDNGHAVGNHTQHHINGWQTDTEEYIDDVRVCDTFMDTQLFRPPYGKLRPSQASALKKEKTIVLWDVLSGDFDERTSPEKCLQNVTQHFGPGSVIVFHDSVKSWEKLSYALPAFLSHLATCGFTSKAITAVYEEVSL